MNDKEKQEQFSSIISSLTPREQKIIRLRYGIDNGQKKTVEEIAKEFNWPINQIIEIETTALRKLNNPIRKQRLAEIGLENFFK